jgi:hypothetical protein
MKSTPYTRSVLARDRLACLRIQLSRYVKCSDFLYSLHYVYPYATKSYAFDDRHRLFDAYVVSGRHAAKKGHKDTPAAVHTALCRDTVSYSTSLF